MYTRETHACTCYVDQVVNVDLNCSRVVEVLERSTTMIICIFSFFPFLFSFALIL